MKNAYDLLLEAEAKLAGEGDPFFAIADKYGFADTINELLTDAFTDAEMPIWLARNGNNPFKAFHLDKAKTAADYATSEEWEKAKRDAWIVSEDGRAIIDWDEVMKGARQ